MKFSWTDPQRKPLIVAHRGSSSTTPENTISAFRQAIIDRADAIELDVHLTKDGEVIVIHDERLARTTNGSGYVRKHTLADIKKLDAGSWFQNKYAGENVPTLAEVFSEFRNKVGINIEIKTESMRRQNMLIVKKCVALIESYNLTKSILVSSFHHPFIRGVKELNPNIPTGLLCSHIHRGFKSNISLAISVGAEYLILAGSMVSKRIIDTAHDNKLLVGEYTINTVRRAERAHQLGIDAVITNTPNRIKEILTIKK